MTKYVLQNGGFATGHPCPVEGLYLAPGYDAEGEYPAGEWVGIGKAQRFDTHLDALNVWHTQRKDRRPDGEPNKPLTAFNIMVVPVEE